MRVAFCVLSSWVLFAATVSSAETGGVTVTLPAKESLPPGALARLGTARFSNFGRVFALAFSPDSRLLAGGCWDGTIQLWDLRTLGLLRQWQAHVGPVRSLAFSPDGATLASVGKGTDVSLWNPETGLLKKTLRGHTGEISVVAFSPTGKHLLSRAYKELILWDSSGAMASKANGPIGGFPYFSADGSHVAFAASRDLTKQTTTIATIDTATGKEVRRIPLPIASQWTTFFSPAGRYVARADHPVFSVYDTSSRRDHRVFETKANYHPYVTSVPFSPDERLFAVVVEAHRLVVMEMASRKIRCEFRNPDSAETVQAFSPDGRFLAGGSLDRSVLLWDLTGQAKSDASQVAPSAKELAALWADLDSADGHIAQRAIWRLVAGARTSLPFLDKVLEVPRPDRQRLAEVLRSLNSDVFTTRRQAFDELERLRDVPESSLKKTLDDPSSSLEHRRRSEELLGRIDTWWEQQWRLVRAIEVVERIGGLEAVQVLGRLAKNEAAPRLAKEADAALTRVARRAESRSR